MVLFKYLHANNYFYLKCFYDNFSYRPHCLKTYFYDYIREINVDFDVAKGYLNKITDDKSYRNYRNYQERVSMISKSFYDNFYNYIREINVDFDVAKDYLQ